jgi:3-keto-disaccharide hydrolase
MFNGKNLDGWDGDPRLWKVAGDEVVGSTDGIEIEANTFLIAKKEYGDFHLKLEVKLRNHNSGVQFRSTQFPDWVVKGLQADMAEGNWWGSIYDEKGTRGVIVNGWKGKAETVVKPGEWNDFEIYCKGDLIQIRVNGLLTSELRDSSKLKGVIGLQLHRGPEMEARFRNVRIKELD